MVGLLSLPRTVRLHAFVSTISPWGRAASRPPAAAGLHLSSGSDKVSLNWHWITHLPSFLPHNVNWLANSHSKAEMSDNWRKQGNVWKYFIIMIREGDKRYFRVSKVGKTVVYLNLSNTLVTNYLFWPNSLIKKSDISSLYLSLLAPQKTYLVEVQCRILCCQAARQPGWAHTASPPRSPPRCSPSWRRTVRQSSGPAPRPPCWRRTTRRCSAPCTATSERRWRSWNPEMKKEVREIFSCRVVWFSTVGASLSKTLIRISVITMVGTLSTFYLKIESWKNV